jgi:hypothetical protein
MGAQLDCQEKFVPSSETFLETTHLALRFSHFAGLLARFDLCWNRHFFDGF